MDYKACAERFNSASFATAYKAALKDLIECGQSVEAVRDPNSPSVGRPMTELLGYKFVLQNPRNRVLGGQVLNIREAFRVANLIWTLDGGTNLNLIGAYHPGAEKFANSQGEFEASFGKRLFGQGQQFACAEKALVNDPSTRRAKALIFSPEDTREPKNDTPCAISLQFFIRDQKLSCICNMRSQSAAKILPYDLYLFSMIHEMMAVRLGVALGDYIHFSESFHFYEDEQTLVESVLKGDVVSDSMPPMTDASDDMIKRVLKLEAALRSTRPKALDFEKLAGDHGVDEYWQGVMQPIARSYTHS